MKNMKKLILALIFVLPIGVLAQTNSDLSPTQLVAQMQTLLNQYSEKIRILEAENNMLRNLMAKNEIQIPLEEYNKILNSTGVITSAPTVLGAAGIAFSELSDLQKWFITQIKLDWNDIRAAYSMPSDAQIGGYEFVKNDKGNNVFVDVIYGNWTPEWAWNAKLLYEFDKTTFKRKLIGFFEYDTTKKIYITKKWNNPFAGIDRLIIRDNITPIAPVVDTNPSTPVVNVNDNTVNETEKSLLSLYEQKKYQELINKSNEYLKNNSATYNIFVYRYRSYFVLGQYQNALNEIEKMQKASHANAKIYCDASVIAQYAKNNTLAESYKKLALAGGTCNVKS